MMDEQAASFEDVVAFTDRFLLLRGGILWFAPTAEGAMPRRAIGDWFTAAASGGGLVASISARGLTDVWGADHDRVTLPTPRGRNLVAVHATPIGFAWQDDTGSVEVCGHSAWKLAGMGASGEPIAEVGFALHAGLCRMHDGTVRYACKPGSDGDPASGEIEKLAKAHPAVRAVAGCATAVALVDAAGRPHFAGHGSTALTNSIPAGLPPLRHIAVAVGRAAAIDESGRIHDFGPNAADRADLPAPMRGQGFARVSVGANWISAIDDAGVAHGYGPDMRAWAHAATDPITELFMTASGARREP